MTTIGESVLASIGEALAAISPVPFVVVDDVSWRVVAANAAAENLYGGSLVGVALESVFTLDGERSVERAVWRAQTSDAPVDLLFERRDGTSAEVLARAHRLDLDGCTACLLVLEDVTGPRSLERSLTHASDERRTLLDALGLGIAELDTSGRIVDHNRFLPIQLLFPGGLSGRNFFLDVATNPWAHAVFQRFQAWAHAVDDSPFREAFEFEIGRYLIEAELLAGSFATCDAIVRLSDATLRRQTEAELRRQTIQAEESARRARLVYQTASLLHQTLDLDEVLETAVVETGRLLGASRCQVVLVDEDGQLLVVHEYNRVPGETGTFGVNGVEASPSVHEALRTLQPVVVESPGDHPLADEDGLLTRSGAVSAIIAPIAVRRDARGVLAILQTDRPRHWTPGDVELAASVASHVSLAIGHSEIHERVRRQADREAVVGRLAVTLHAAESLDAALSSAADALLRALEATGVSVLTRSRNGDGERVWCWKRSPEGACVAADPVSFPLAAAARRALDGDPAGDAPSTVVAPFSSRDGVSGVLAMSFGEPKADREARALVDAVAVHVGIVVGASTLLETAMDARQVWEGTFDAMPDGVVVHDASFRIVRVNRQFGRLVRSQPARLVGAALLDLFSDAAGEAIRDGVEQVGNSRKPAQVEVEDAALGRWLAISVSRLETAARPSYILSVRDVTEERTIADRLAQSSKMASIGQLAAGVAHEINTPLATIAGSAQSLDRQLAGMQELKGSERWPAIRERLDAIVDQSFRCKRITRDLLDFAAPQRPNVHECELSAVVAEAIEAVARERGTASIRVRVTGRPAPVATDADLVGQVLVNLMTNGLDALDVKGRGTLTVEVRHVAREARILIRDTGPGIPPDVLDRIFDPFFTTKAPGRGTGLGLSISQSIVARLGGRLEVRSRPGRGATFTITLPRRRQPEEAG